jgi:photosystem II stability/assembly factor-like uncharacterized protein
MARPTVRVSLLISAVAISLPAGWSITSARRAAAPSALASIDTTILNRFRWRSIGPDRGGRALAVAGVKGRPREGYFGTTGGGLWKTTNGGESWAPVTDFQVTSASVGAVAVSESNPDVVYIGMGESCIRGNIMPGDGVYKSTDAGKTWTHIGFRNVDAISRIRVHPSNPDIVFVAVFGKYSVPSDERGVFKSTDGGKTWRKVLFRDNKSGGIDISIDPHNPNTMYAALWEAYRVEYSMSSGGQGSGLFKSTDGGETWKEITRNPGMPTGLVGKIGVAVSGADPNRVYAIVENTSGGLFRSDDAGATWTLANSGRNIRQRAFYYTHVTADPNNKDRIYVQNVGTFTSVDAGKTLTSWGGSDSHDLWVDPDDSQHVMYANDGGGTITYNSLTPQRTFSSRDYPTGQFYHVVTTKHVPYHVCGAQQDASTVCIPRDIGRGGAGGRGGGGGGGRGAPAPQLYSPGGAEPAYIAPDPKDPDAFFSGGNNGSFLVWTNRRTGQSREVNPYPRMFSGEPSSALVERWQWTYPIIFSPVDPAVLYTSSQHVWKTTNGGQSWVQISPDLSRHDPKTMGPSGGPITGDMNAPEVYALVFALGPSKRDVNVLWAGSDDGVVSVTRDGGKSWATVTPREMPDFGRVSIIDASAFDVGTAYVAVKRPLLDDRAPYVFRTHDFGKTWTKIVTGIRADDYVHAVREDPARRGLLYAAAQHGVYLSYDDGDHWESLSLNLPDIPISDLAVEANDLAISTHGRGFYILDDIGPLRQYSPAMIAAPDAFLFQPPDAIRSAGAATIPYWIKHPVETLTIEVLDAKGDVVRTFTGAPPAAGGRGGRGGRGGDAAAAGGVNPDDAGGGGGGRGGRGGAGGNNASMATGFNTVSWDLRYPSAVSFPGMVLWGGNVTGPVAVPGTYQVRLTVDGKSQTQPLVVKKHPLYTDVTQADLQEQFNLAIQIRDKVTEANNAVIQIRNLKSQVADRLAKSPDARLKERGDTLSTHMSGVEEDVYQVRNQSSQDPLNFPIKINNRLASLLSVVNRGDGKPIGNAAPIFKDLAAELKVQTDRLQIILKNDLAAFNAEAKRLGLELVTVAPIIRM